MEWLQFNDFHIGNNRAPDITVLSALLDKVRQVIEASPKIDLVFLAGDIAYSGKAEEYESFTKHFLIPLKEMPKISGAVFVAVPGNHDVKCDECLPITWNSIGARNQTSFFGENDEGIKIRRSRAVVFEPYKDFITKNSIISPTPDKEISLLYDATNLPFKIVATNTSFFSHYEFKSSEPETPFPLLSLRQYLSPGSSDKPIIVVGHHCPSSLLEADHQQLRSLLKEKKAIYIHGHEHKASVAFDHEGTISTLGFGASYVTPLQNSKDNGYRNSFAYCKATERLAIISYSWEPEKGVWINSTEKEFSDLAEFPAESTEKGRHGRLPKIADSQYVTRQRPNISTVPRVTARPISVVPVDPTSEVIWKQLFNLSNNIKRLLQKESPQYGAQEKTDGRGEFTFEADDGRHLVVCIAGSNQMLSAKEVETFNTRLDTEDLSSITVLSFGHISEDAHRMYVKLRTKKAVEILTNKELTASCEDLLAPKQIEELSKLDAAKCEVHVLIEDEATYLLIVLKDFQASSFHLTNKDGQRLSPSDELILKLRKGNPDFASMPYTEEGKVHASLIMDTFNENEYLKKSWALYNIVKYAPLAQAGVRFEDLPLDKLFVSPNASEISRGGARLEAFIDDYLASYALSDGLKEQLEKQLLERFSRDQKQEVSAARDFCQKYGAVLVIGDPGAGKTCFIKNEVLSYCSRAGSEGRDSAVDWYSIHIPVLVQLSEVVRETDLSQQGIISIASRLLARKGLGIPESFLKQNSDKGRIAWFFDGLDEVVSIEKRALVVQQINELVESTQLMGNRFIVTSRPAAIRVVNLLPSLHNLEIQGFNEAQIETLARRVLQTRLIETPAGTVLDQGAKAQTHSNLVRQLLDDCHRKPGVARLAQNPLLLTLLMLIYANAGAPSAKRHLIYSQAIEVLAAVRGRETGHNPISPQDLRERLGAVALSVYKKESGLLPSRKEVCKVIRDVMEKTLNRSVNITEVDEFIQKVAESTGLIAVESQQSESDDMAVVTFMHHSFLEYYAAIALSSDLSALNIAEIVNQPRWHEIVTLLAGIIGDRADIAPILEKILTSSDAAGNVEAKLLLFALDCALECEVPSEASQYRLGVAIKECLLSGPARVDPWVRTEIGTRLGQLLHSCGGGALEGAIVEAITVTDPEACAAGISFASDACSQGFESAKIVKAIETACQRTEDIVLSAVCHAAADCRSFRTDITIQTIQRSLVKTGSRKKAAFTALEKMPDLAARNWPEIINGIDDKDRSIREKASGAALNAGLNSDLITLTASKRDILVRAFEHCDFAHTGIDRRGPNVRRQTVEQMLDSSYEKDKLIGIQLLPFVREDEAYVHEKLFDLLNKQTDRVETVAVLNALNSKGTTSLFKQADLRQILILSKEGTLDIRISAIKLLGRFSNSTFVIEELLKREVVDMTAEEYRPFMLALGNALVCKQAVLSILESQIDYLLNEHRKMTKENEQKLVSVLWGLRRLEESCSEERIDQILGLVRGHRSTMDIKQAAILCYPAVAIPSKKVVEEIRLLCMTPSVGIDNALVQMPGIFASKCKKSIEYVLACVPSLTPLREALIALHKKYSARAVSEDTELYITELRQGISEITLMLVTFNEFIKPTNGAVL